MKLRRLLPLLLVVCGLLPAIADEPASWPQWRGADRSGHSPDTGLLDQWPLDGPKLLLTIPDAGLGYSSVSVIDGRIYTLGARKNGEYVFAFDAETGREIWSRRISGPVETERGSGPRSTPTVVGKELYVLSSGGELVCLSAKRGKIRWSFSLVERFGGETPRWGWSESPLVDGDRVIGLSGGTGGSMFAVDRRTGKTLWRSEGLEDAASYASGVIAEIDGVRQVAHFTAEAAVGVRLDDGKPMWRYETVANHTANCATPIVHGNEVFYTSEYNRGNSLLRLSSENGITDATEVYYSRGLKNQHGGAVLYDGHVYGYHHALLACINWETGERLWRDRAVGKGSVTLADGKLYVYSEAGTVGLVRPSSEGYEELSRFTLDLRGHPTWAHPVVVDGRLYLRNGEQIAVYDVRTSHLSAEQQQFEDAVRQFRSGEHGPALELFRNRAKSGDAEAENFVGVAYRDGRGTEKDEAEALRWFRRAAEGGSAKAQFNLGAVMTAAANPDRDLIQGCMWFVLAAEGGVKRARTGLEHCAAALTEDELQQAKDRAAER